MAQSGGDKRRRMLSFGAAMGVALLLLVVAAQPVEAVQSYRILPFEEDYKYQRNCYATFRPPQKPETLMFCMQFNEKACCPPAQDEQNLNYFRQMFENGLSCRLRGDLRSNPFGLLYCMNCDPQQPMYVRNLPYFPLLTNQEYLNMFPLPLFPSWRIGRENLPLGCVTGSGGNTIGTPLSFDKASYKQCYATRRIQVLVSRSWAVNSFLIRPHIMSVLDGCMVQKSAPCLDSAGAILPNRERFACGNDLVNPGIFFGLEAAAPAYTASLPGMCKLNNFTAKGMYPEDDNCRTMYLERVLNNDDLATPGVSENFGIRLVDDRLCSASEYSAWKAKFQANLDSSFVDATTINNFNPHLANGPICLMTKAQVMDSAKLFAWPPVNLTDEYAHDEVCFSSTSVAGVGRGAWVGLVGLVLGVLWLL